MKRDEDATDGGLRKDGNFQRNYTVTYLNGFLWEIVLNGSELVATVRPVRGGQG